MTHLVLIVAAYVLLRCFEFMLYPESRYRSRTALNIGVVVALLVAAAVVAILLDLLAPGTPRLGIR